LKRLLPLLLLLCATGCQSGAGADALVTSAIALSASAASRASGGCYAACPTGTTCNGATGLCDELPCRGQCPEGSYCEESARIPHCVRLKPVELKIVQPAPAPAPEDAPKQASEL
jgi:hypothetical protein